MTIDRQCGSSQQAVHFAAQAVMSGTQDLVVAGGVQNMSMIPIGFGVHGSARAARLHRPVLRLRRLGGALRRPGGHPVPRRRADRREVGHLPRGHGGVRAQLATSARCRRSTRAASTARSCRSASVTHDEGPRRDTTLEKMASLPHAARGRHASPRRCPARSPTAPRRCWSPPSGRVKRARAHAAGAHPPPLRARRRPDAACSPRRSRRRARAGEDRPVARRHRPGRDQRGVRAGRARLAEGDRAPTSAKVNVNGGAIALGHPLGRHRAPG